MGPKIFRHSFRLSVVVDLHKSFVGNVVCPLVAGYLEIEIKTFKKIQIKIENVQMNKPTAVRPHPDTIAST